MNPEYKPLRCRIHAIEMYYDRKPAIEMCDPYACTEAALAKAVTHQDQIVFFNCLDLYHTSPDSGERQYKSRA